MKVYKLKYDLNFRQLNIYETTKINKKNKIRLTTSKICQPKNLLFLTLIFGIYDYNIWSMKLNLDYIKVKLFWSYNFSGVFNCYIRCASDKQYY